MCIFGKTYQDAREAEIFQRPVPHLEILFRGTDIRLRMCVNIEDANMVHVQLTFSVAGHLQNLQRTPKHMVSWREFPVLQWARTMSRPFVPFRSHIRKEWQEMIRSICWSLQTAKMTSTSWNFLQTNISEEEINNEEALIQQNNKNRKCILSSLQKRCRASGGSDSNLNPMFIDVIGKYSIAMIDLRHVILKLLRRLSRIPLHCLQRRWCLRCCESNRKTNISTKSICGIWRISCWRYPAHRISLQSMLDWHNVHDMVNSVAFIT